MASTPPEEHLSPISILRDLQKNKLAATSINSETRRQCVEHLTAEGCSAAEIAELLQVSTRTICRDLERIRSEHTLTRDPQVVDQLVGQTAMHAKHAQARLARISREKRISAVARVEAEMGGWRIQKELVLILQRLGILPEAAKEIRADLTHRVATVPSTEDLKLQLESLQGLLTEGDSSEIVEALQSVDGLVSRAMAAEGFEQIANLVEDGETDEGGVDDES